ncbi:unnamed protein product, partial [Ectocarpus fasciculatus]
RLLLSLLLGNGRFLSGVAAAAAAAASATESSAGSAAIIRRTPLSRYPLVLRAPGESSSGVTLVRWAPLDSVEVVDRRSCAGVAAVLSLPPRDDRRTNAVLHCDAERKSAGTAAAATTLVVTAHPRVMMLCRLAWRS